MSNTLIVPVGMPANIPRSVNTKDIYVSGKIIQSALFITEHYMGTANAVRSLL